MSVVVDASVVVAGLLDSGWDGQWALGVLAQPGVSGPQLVTYEASNVLRRLELSGAITADTAALAHRDLRSLPIDLAPYLPFAQRIWDLRRTLTVYDASYVALAEALGVPLATLDSRLGRAPGPRCPLLTPD
jgi:predicted nucleic acid-binding protein